jgi:hypothetical protein
MTNTFMENIWNMTEVGTPVHYVTITLKALSKGVLEQIVEKLSTVDVGTTEPVVGYCYDLENVEYKQVPTTEEDYK